MALALFGCASKQPPKTAVERLGERVSQQAENDAQASLDRMDALDDAKTVAVAAIKAAGDHDDRLPGPSDYKAFVRPYMPRGREAALDRFVWVFPGGYQTGVESVVTTELGHVGAAVAYVDGHVRAPEPAP